MWFNIQLRKAYVESSKRCNGRDPGMFSVSILHEHIRLDIEEHRDRRRSLFTSLTHELAVPELPQDSECSPSVRDPCQNKQDIKREQKGTLGTRGGYPISARQAGLRDNINPSWCGSFDSTTVAIYSSAGFRFPGTQGLAHRVVPRPRVPPKLCCQILGAAQSTKLQLKGTAGASRWIPPA